MVMRRSGLHFLSKRIEEILTRVQDLGAKAGKAAFFDLFVPMFYSQEHSSPTKSVINANVHEEWSQNVPFFLSTPKDVSMIRAVDEINFDIELISLPGNSKSY